MSVPPPSDSILTERSGRIVAAHKLLRRARRDQSAEFLAEGAQAVREAVAQELLTPGVVIELFVTETGASRNVEIVREAFRADLTVTQITNEAAAKLSDTVHPQGLIAHCRAVSTDLDIVLARNPKRIAVLVETADPGNAGTVVRLADASGCDAVVVTGDSVDLFNPKAVRASTGSVFHLPLVRVPNPMALIAALKGAEILTVATTGTGDLDLDDALDNGKLTGPTAWLFGSEAHGLPDEVIAAADERVVVPIHGRAESLNLATAAAVCLYASARAQR